ncbi:hypothetical protein Aperf_G00000021810 [Anoplocephala perfoliata]
MTDTSEELAARRNRLAVAPQNCSTDTGASNIRDGVQTVEEAFSNEDNFEDSCRLSVLNLPDQSDLPVEQPRPIATRTDEVRRRNRVPMRNLIKNSSESSELDIRGQQHADAIGNRNFDNFYSSISAFDDGKYTTNDGSLKEIQVQRRKPSVQSDVDIAHQSKPSLMQNISSNDVDFQHANSPDYAVFSRNDAASDSFQLQQDRRYSFQWSSPNAQHYPTVINEAGLSYIRGTPIHQPYSSGGTMASLNPPESAVGNFNPNTTHSTLHDDLEAQNPKD